MPAPIDNWILVGAGYMQRRGNTEQGMPRLTHELHARYASAKCRVEFCTWNEDWASLAEWIFRSSQNGHRPKIMLAFYSWCVGYGAVNLLRELRYRGLIVDACVFADGVYHLGGPLFHKLRISQVAAYVRLPIWKPQIFLPGNINRDNIHWFVQDDFRLLDTKTWLRGHELVWESTGEPVPGKEVLKGVSHRYVDDAPEFKERVFDVADRVFGKGVAA